MKANHKTTRRVAVCATALLCGLFGPAFGTLASSAAGDCENEWVISDEQHMGQDETYDCVHILSTGRLYTNGYKLTVTGADGLTIDAGGKLFINNSSGAVVLTGGGTSTVDGRIYLQVSGSELEIDEASHTLEGSGRIIGEHNGARITIQCGRTLTSEITIEGALEIRRGTAITPDALGRGTFVNNGLVHANHGNVNDDTLKLASGTIDDSSGATRWQVSHADAVLWFNVNATGLDGDVTIDAGTLDIDENVDITPGDLYMSCPSYIQVAGGKSFTYDTYSGDCATDPSNPLTADFDCLCP